jgi:hypothetical protein
VATLWPELMEAVTRKTAQAPKVQSRIRGVGMASPGEFVIVASGAVGSGPFLLDSVILAG